MHVEQDANIIKTNRNTAIIFEAILLLSILSFTFAKSSISAIIVIYRVLIYNADRAGWKQGGNLYETAS